MKYLLTLVVTFLFIACGGYKPVPQYSNDIFAQPVLIKVKMDPEDPESGVFLQDELGRMAVNRLNLTLTKDVDEAKSYILVNSYTINTTPLNEDENGNVIRYSVNAAIEFAIKDKYGFWSKNIVSSEYVDVKPQAGTSYYDKDKAGRAAIQKALDTFVLATIERSRKVGNSKQEIENAKKGEESQKETIANSVTQDGNAEVSSSAFSTSNSVFNENANDFTNSVFQNQNNIPNNQNEQQNSQNDLNITIIPTNSNDTLIEDATNYN